MSQLDGGLTVDDGYRAAVAGSTSTRPSTSTRSSEGSARIGDYYGAEWVLPGFGESGVNCGTWFPEAVCTGGHISLSTHSCGRRSCERCWGLWALDAGVRITLRIQAWRFTQPPDWRRQAAHAVVSPPEGEIRTEREYWDGYAEAADLLKSKGWRGFTVIGHPYRPTDEAKELFEAADTEVGIWVWMRDKYDENRQQELRRWSPHYHAIGATGKDMEPAKESDPWVYQFERSLSTFDDTHDKESHDDLYGLTRYLLSHTGFPRGSTKQITRWYGSLANSVFVEPPARESWQYEKPSEGVLSVLEREIREVAGGAIDEDDDQEGSVHDDLGECPREGCGAVLIDVFDIRAFLRQQDVSTAVSHRMRTALDWRMGDVKPPPGLKNPRTEEEAMEAWEALLGEK